MPGVSDAQTAAEHLARYRLAARLVDGRRVLDLACGTGYGMPLLQEGGSQSIAGIDRSVEVLADARASYGAITPGYAAAQAQALPFRDGCFDVVIALEIIEHLTDPESLLREVRRVLAPEGLLLVSTPNRTTYRDERDSAANPHHVREFYRAEFEDLLLGCFAGVELLGQWTVEGVLVARLDKQPVTPTRDSQDLPGHSSKLGDVSKEPDYFVALCRREAPVGGDLLATSSLGLPFFLAPPGLDSFRRLRLANQAMRQDLDEKRLWAFRLQADLDRSRSRVRELDAEVEEKVRWVALQEDELRDRRADVGQLQAELEGQMAPAAPIQAAPARAALWGVCRSLLIVASAAPAVVEQVHQRVGERYRANRVRYAAGSGQREVLAELARRGEQVLTWGGKGWFAMWRRLRDDPADLVFVTLTGERGYRRLRSAALLAAGRRLVVVDELGRLFPGGSKALFGYCWRRFRDVVDRLWQVIRAALQRPAPMARVEASWPRLHFGTSEAPRVSLIVPARDHWDYTHRCLASILEHTATTDYEVVLVDDASHDETRRAERFLSGVRVIHRRESGGYLPACNDGAEVARGRFLLFLNNDVVVTPGWLEEMLLAFSGRPDCGAVGAKLVYPDGRLQEAGCIVWQDGNAWNVGRNETPSHWRYNYARQVDYCSGAALLVRRDAFDRIGGFDLDFGPGYWEDTDMCFSLRRAGFQVWYQPTAVVVHFEGLTSGTDENLGSKRFQAVNRSRFFQKWAAELALQPRFDPQHGMFLARDRNHRPVILVIDHYVPTPDRDAGSYFMDEFLQALVTLGYRVVFWPDNLHPLPGYTERLQSRGVEVVYGATSLHEFVAEMGRPFDSAIVHRCKIAERYFPELVGLTNSRCYLAADLEYLREQRRHQIENTDAQTANAALSWLLQREKAVTAAADWTTVHSPVELAWLESELPGTSVHHLVLPSPRFAVGDLSFAERRDLLFVGSTHPPNVDAARWFAERILPAVRQSIPDLRLRVVGEVCRDLSMLTDLPGVDLVGHVDRLDESLSHARLFVAPLRYGAGIKGKVLMAMNSGVPVVVTGIAAEGIGLVDRRSAMIADSEEDFAAAVVATFNDEALWRRLQHGATEVAKGFSTDVFTASVGSLLAKLLSGRPEVR